MKRAGHHLEPKAVICLIDELRHISGELEDLLRLLNELSDLDYWVDGCYRVIQYCVENNHLSTAVDLFKQLKDHFKNDEIMTEVLLDGHVKKLNTVKTKSLECEKEKVTVKSVEGVKKKKNVKSVEGDKKNM
ncbi:hypothetical protein QL285_019719 [Trifolium repens]|nr:hypothetical protein QL285_019719 [Trifolium repens]